MRKAVGPVETPQFNLPLDLARGPGNRCHVRDGGERVICSGGARGGAMWW
jgi:hypothetical protein